MKNIESFLTKSGYRALHLTLTTIGGYSPRDSEWNYSDIPHLNYIHTQVAGLTLFASSNFIASIFLQKIGFLSFPAAVSILHSTQDLHEYAMVILGLVIHVKTSHEAHTSGCKTTTTYAFYHRGPLGRLLAYVARYSTKKNYAVLMSEDMPMRDQRGYLRQRGISFAYDKQSLIGFEETTDIGEDHVDASAMVRDTSMRVLEVKGESGLLEVDEYLLCVSWDIDHVYILPSICPHEGAPLRFCPPHASPKGGSPSANCPWHGRRLTSLAVLERGKLNQCSVSFCKLALSVSIMPNPNSKELHDQLTVYLKNPEVGSCPLE